MLADQIFSHPTPTQEPRKFLAFQLCQETKAMIEVKSILATLQVPKEQIVGIPDMPAWVMGAYNWRGEILWIVDLAQHLGLIDPPSISKLQRQAVLITQVADQLMGIAVAQVHDILSFVPEAIASIVSTPVTTPALAAVLRGSVLHDQGSILLWLEVPAIYQHMREQIRVA